MTGTNEDFVRDIVTATLEERLGHLLLGFQIDDVARRVTDRLAEVKLIREDS